MPGSKSLSNRYLLLAALAQGSTRLSGVLRSEDTDAMLGALKALGVVIENAGEDAFVLHGIGGCAFPVEQAFLHLGNAGTAMRPLCAALCAAQGDYVLDGIERMRERPIGDLLDALRPLLDDSGDISCLGSEGYPPLQLRARGLNGGCTRISGSTSSQFLSALLLASPLAKEPVEIEVVGELISKPYVDITLGLMKLFGVEVEREEYKVFRIRPAVYRSPGEVQVEGDASSASYFLGFGALGGPVRVLGCGENSIQGDAAFADVLGRMGAVVRKGLDWIEVERPASGFLQALDIDMTDMPDAAMTLATLALFARGKTVLRGIGSWRVKETERIVAVRAELEKLGARVEEGPDWIAILPPDRICPATIETYKDHRMAMAFSLAAAGGTTIEVLDPGCVAKTFPDYFAVLGGLEAS